MVNNQTEFSDKFTKEAQKIELKYKKFQGELIVEGYSELKNLYLKNVKNIDKITLKDLPQLQECII